MAKLKRTIQTAASALAMMFGMAAGEVAAQSRSSVTVNGKQIVVVGGARSSVNSSNGVVTMTVDGRTMTVADGILTVDGQSVPLGDYSRVEIFIEPEGVRVLSDGRVVLDPATAPPTTKSEGPADGSAEQVDLAVRLFRGDGIARDVPRSVALMTRAAEAGNPYAQRNIGLLYRDGMGVARNNSTALMWLERAALAGDGIAQDELSEMYIDGRATETDLANSYALYKSEADSGNATAMNNLGYAYEHGLGVAPDKAAALRWYAAAAEADDRAGQFNYGLMLLDGDEAADAVAWLQKSVAQDYAPAFNALGFAHDNGLGVAPDPVEAVRLYRIAAERGLRAAQFNLGLSYEQGTGVARDRDQAVRWLQAASEQGHNEATAAILRLQAAPAKVKTVE